CASVGAARVLTPNPSPCAGRGAEGALSGASSPLQGEGARGEDLDDSPRSCDDARKEPTTMTGWEGRVAVVTGAAGGIGLAIARDLAGHGVRVTLADVDAAAGQARAAELPGARFAQSDLAAAVDCRRLIAETLAAEGRVDILVNNAGIQH